MTELSHFTDKETESQSDYNETKLTQRAGENWNKNPVSITVEPLLFTTPPYHLSTKSEHDRIVPNPYNSFFSFILTLYPSRKIIIIMTASKLCISVNIISSFTFRVV